MLQLPIAQLLREGGRFNAYSPFRCRKGFRRAAQKPENGDITSMASGIRRSSLSIVGAWLWRRFSDEIDASENAWMKSTTLTSFLLLHINSTLDWALRAGIATRTYFAFLYVTGNIAEAVEARKTELQRRISNTCNFLFGRLRVFDDVKTVPISEIAVL